MPFFAISLSQVATGGVYPLIRAVRDPTIDLSQPEQVGNRGAAYDLFGRDVCIVAFREHDEADESGRVPVPCRWAGQESGPICK